MSSKKKRRIVRYKRRSLNLNIGIIIFLVIFAYISVSCFLYLTQDKVSIYEVVKGESENIPGISTTGIALRTEKLFTTPSTGYINYYVKADSKVAVGSTVYSVDANGDFSELMQDENISSTALTSDNLNSIKTDITDFIEAFNSEEFSDVYDFRYNLNSTLIECINTNSLDTINQTLAANGGNALSLVKSDTSGIIEFYSDGFENTTVNDITEDMFDEKNYKKTVFNSENMVETNSNIYKLVTDENWNIVIQLNDEQAKNYAEVTNVDVYFPNKNITAPANFSVSNLNGKNYGVISLKRYMVQFADSRFIDLQIKGTSTSGLKIPKTALVNKSFYAIPKEYLTKGGDSNEDGFNVEVISDSGESSAEFKPFDIVEETDDTCYVDVNDIDEGTVILKNGDSSKYKVAATEELQGVYNVNTGLTNFVHVNILSEKNGYYLVESGTTYGLQVYDQIILNAKLVKDNQVIFK